MQDKLTPRDAQALELTRQLITQRLGISYSDKHIGLLRRQLLELAVRLRCRSLSDLLLRLQLGDNNAWQLLTHRITINHTFFFREMNALEALVTEVAPHVRTLPAVRVWSAAAASGEELYTLAMLLSEAIGLATVEQRFRFLGTDLNSNVVAFAEAGLYRERQVDKVPVELRERYFTREPNGGYRVTPRLRELCTFRRMNLVAYPYPFTRSFHIVLCRNVLYYFDVEQRRKVLAAIHAVTSPEGYLQTSVSDAIEPLGTAWHRRSKFLYVPSASGVSPTQPGARR